MLTRPLIVRCVAVALVGLLLGSGCGDDDNREDDPDELSTTTSAVTRSFATNSLIIPLDTTSQDAGALRAYGLVYQLLRGGVPVHWAMQDRGRHRLHGDRAARDPES